MVVYGDEQSGYPHPDHLRVHEVGVAAFRAAGDAEPLSRAPARPGSRTSSTTRSSRWPGFGRSTQKFEELGLESPFDEEWRKRWDDIPAPVVTTSVDISEFADVRSEALLAHATQVDPKSPFWFGLPPEVMRSIHPFDDYRLALVVGPDGNLVAPATVRDGADGRRRRRDAICSPGSVRPDRPSARREPREPWGRGALGLGRTRGRALGFDAAWKRRNDDDWGVRDQVAVRGVVRRDPGMPWRAGTSRAVGSDPVEITGGPDGEATYYWVLEDGRLVSSGAGPVEEPT